MKITNMTTKEEKPQVKLPFFTLDEDENLTMFFSDDDGSIRFMNVKTGIMDYAEYFNVEAALSELQSYEKIVDVEIILKNRVDN